jgi:hypothetical protein
LSAWLDFVNLDTGRGRVNIILREQGTQFFMKARGLRSATGIGQHSKGACRFHCRRAAAGLIFHLGVGVQVGAAIHNLKSQHARSPRRAGLRGSRRFEWLRRCSPHMQRDFEQAVAATRLSTQYRLSQAVQLHCLRASHNQSEARSDNYVYNAADARAKLHPYGTQAAFLS